MTGRRKGTPCACEMDPCSCGSSKGKCVRAVNNVSPDPNGDLIIRGGSGIEVTQSGDDIIINNTANPNAFVAGNNIEFNPSGDDISIDLVDEPVVDGLTVNGDTQLNGNLEVNGDIIQNGAAYETHAEHIYSRDDFIIMRDGAIAALAPGDYAGFKVKLYDGVNDGALVIDNTGTARVGDVGDEQPLLTRDEAADLTDGDSLVWDSANSKAVTEAIPSAISTALAAKEDVLTVSSGTISTSSQVSGGTASWKKYGKIVIVQIFNITSYTAGDIVVGTLPYTPASRVFMSAYNNSTKGMRPFYTDGNNLGLYVASGDNGTFGTLVYVTN